jgi:hypothetical protein
VGSTLGLLHACCNSVGPTTLFAVLTCQG